MSTDETGEAAAFTGEGGVKLREACDDIAGNAAGLIVAPRRLCRAVQDRDLRSRGTAAGGRGCARAHLRSARSAAATGRSRRARLPGRGRVAAGDALRSLAQPSHALRARPGPAGAANFALGTRFCAGARRRRGDPRLSRQARGRADRDLALRPTARRGRRRRALEPRMQQRRALSQLGARARPCRRAQAYRQAGAEAAARRAANRAVRHRYRELAARSVHHLCQVYPQAARARSHRPAAGRVRPRHRHPRCAGRIHQDVRGRPAGRPHRRPDRNRRQAFRRAGRLPRGARVLVAALPAHRPLVRGLGDGAARQDRGAHRRGLRQDRHPAGRARVHAALPRRPHRATGRRPLRHSRLQDRDGADREAGAHRHLAAAHARSRDSARGEFPGIAAGASWPSSSTSRSRAASRAGEGRADRLQGRQCRHARRSRARQAHGGRHAIRGRAATLSPAGAVDVEEPLRHLRPPRAGEGMVGRQRG